MAPKQDIDKGIAINMAGTLPHGHALAPIRKALLDNPRQRQWVIGQVVNKHTGVDHPADGEDQKAPVLLFVELAAVTDTAAIDQLAAMLNRITSSQPGQSTIDEHMPVEGGNQAHP